MIEVHEKKIESNGIAAIWLSPAKELMMQAQAEAPDARLEEEQLCSFR
jgi:hypothetical protein